MVRLSKAIAAGIDGVVGVSRLDLQHREGCDQELPSTSAEVQNCGHAKTLTTIEALIEFPPEEGATASAAWKERIATLLHMSRQEEHAHSHACGQGSPPDPNVVAVEPAFEAATGLLHDPPNDPVEETREQVRKWKRTRDATAGHDGRSTTVERVIGPERSSLGPQEGVSTRSVSRKCRFQEESRLTKQVPLGTDATRCIIIDAQLTAGQEEELVGFL